MTARSEILDAARYLTDQGRVPFSPKDIIVELRRRGSRYPDVTIRSHVVNQMCVNSPEHGIKYDDLRRVGHGQYVLASDRPRPAVASSRGETTGSTQRAMSTSDADPGTPARSWMWEGSVQSVVVSHLSDDGWEIVATADTASRQAGADVLARKGGRELIVEVKGFPDREKSSANTQARHYAGGALLTGLLAWSDHPHASVLLVFPEATTYRNLARRLRVALERVGISWWFVHADGRVERWLDLTVTREGN